MIVLRFYFVVEMTISKGWNKFCIYILIQFFEIFAHVRNGPNYVCDFIFKTTNNHTISWLWFYRSYFTQNFKLVNLFSIFFSHIGIFKFLVTNFPSKVSVTFINELSLDSENILVVCCDAYDLTASHVFVGSG